MRELKPFAPAEVVNNMGWAYLILLIVQNTSKTLIMRYAVRSKANFLYSAAVVATESLKALISVVWVLSTGGSAGSILHHMRTDWRTFLRLLVPAGVYNCQQMLEFVALSRLEAPLFSVIVQTKLLTTALFTWILLGKRLRRNQIFALMLLVVGVVLAQMRSDRKSDRNGSANNDSALLLTSADRDTLIGVVATLVIATLSGFAAVYTERVLKKGGEKKVPLAYTQVQMALASLLMIGLFTICTDLNVIFERGLWYGFDGAAAVAVLNSALGGLVVSAVLRYADSVLKGYATAASVIFTGILSWAFFGSHLGAYFGLSVITVTVSLLIYNRKPPEHQYSPLNT